MMRGARSLRIVVPGVLIPAIACNLSPLAASPTVAPLFSTPSPAVGPAFPDPQREAFEALAAASSSPPSIHITAGFPRSLAAHTPLVGDTPAEQALAFLETYRDLYRLGSPDLALGVEDVRQGPQTVVTLFQTYRGLPVYGGELTVAIANDGTLTTIGELLSADVNLDVVPGLTENEAVDLARTHLGSPTALRAGPAQLVIYDPFLLGDPAPDPHLAWQLRLTGAEPWELFVDAQSGAVLSASSLLDRFPGSHSDDWDLDLEDANGNNIQNSGCYWWTSDDDEIGDEDGLYYDYSPSSAAFLMWQGAKEAFSFYHGFGRHSFDGDNVEVEFYVDADLPGNTIAWTAVSSDCDAVDYDTDDYPVSDAVVTHEFTHGVIEYTSDFSNSGQPDALDEAYADIMGIWDTKDWTFDGLVNESNLALHFDDYDPAADEHDNGRIFVTAFSYIVKGVKFGDLVDIDGFNLGDSRVGTLFYLTMIYLNSSSSFLDARDLTLAFAPQVGFNPGEVCDIQNAFYATGIGFPDFNCNGIPDNPDKDGDSIDDTFDNCPGVFNGGQEDTDGDGNGDACDNDLDGDGVPNAQDNCVDVPNADQENKDLDFLGKACDPDEDEDFDDDGVLNEFDNCAFDPNPDQADVDNDGDGDACDPDSDGDGISNDDDNCPFTLNPDQANADGDGAGDACDACAGAGDVNAWTTGIPELGIDPKPFVPDSDGDGIPDACDRTPYLDGQPWSTGVDHVVPGGPDLPGEAEGGPGTFVTLPLPVCPPGGDGAHQESDRQRLLLAGLSDRVRAWISDGGGDPVMGAPDPDEVRTINFQPQGGEAYWLNLQFAPDFPEGQAEEFGLRLFCESHDEQARWTPTPTATASFTPTPTPTASATPTVTPTIYLRPSLTPTPTPRR